MRKRRYRCTRREFFMNLPNGKRLHWAGYRYPPKGHSPCTDDFIIDFIESKPIFGTGIVIDKAPEDIIINPAAVPVDCDTAILQKAARRLVELGKHVNPKLLKEDEDEVKGPEKPPQPPIKSVIAAYKRDELEALIKEFSWDIDVANLNVAELKKAVRAKIEESSE